MEFLLVNLSQMSLTFLVTNKCELTVKDSSLAKAKHEKDLADLEVHIDFNKVIIHIRYEHLLINLTCLCT